jgi:hypothetical protein
MSEEQPLAIYLNDHLAGSAAGRDLAERIRSQNEGTALGAFLAGLLREIEEDRDTLADLMRRLGIEQSSLKQTAGAALEKLSRAVFDVRGQESRELRRLLELEMLWIGIQGKLALWRALRAIEGRGRQLPAIDLERLIHRAQEQLDGVERHRLEAAIEVFV